MLHTKAVATQDTVFWEEVCKASYQGNGMCRLGTPYLDDMTGVNEEEGDEGWKYNCYINKRIDNYFVPRLEQELKKHIPELAEQSISLSLGSFDLFENRNEEYRSLEAY
jgi:hypothetical protein